MGYENSNKVLGIINGYKLYIKCLKIVFSQTRKPNAFIFGIEHPWGKEIEHFTNEVPEVQNYPAQGINSLYKNT